MSAYRQDRWSVALLLMVVLPLAACHHTTRVRTAPIGEETQIALASPRTLRLVQPRGDTATLAGVLRLTGRVLADRDGTIEVLVTRAADSAGRQLAVSAGARAIIPQDASPVFEKRRFSIIRSALAFVVFSCALFAFGLAVS